MSLQPFSQLLLAEFLSFRWSKLLAHFHSSPRVATLPDFATPDYLVGKDSQPVIAEAKTLHLRHIFIFLDQLSWGFPRQSVPLINQQRSPTLNSQAGQASRIEGEHFRISQQRFKSLKTLLFIASKKSIWRSTGTGTFRHPCSRLWTDLRDAPSSWDSCFCVFWSFWRIKRNSLLSMNIPPLEKAKFYWSIYHVVASWIKSIESPQMIFSKGERSTADAWWKGAGK